MPNIEKNIISGFSGMGIVPLNPEQLLKRLPKKPTVINNNKDENHWKDILMEMFEGTRHCEKPKLQKRKKIAVEPRKSVSVDDTETEENDDDLPEEDLTDDDNSEDAPEEETEQEEEIEDFREELDCVDINDLKKEDFVEIRFTTNKNNKYFGVQSMILMVIKSLLCF